MKNRQRPLPSCRFRFAGCAIAVLVATLAGCGPQRPATVPVEGIVTLDGKPVADATVLFMPIGGGRPADGTTDAQGRFKLTTFEAGDGAVPGAHQVTVQKVRVKKVQSAGGTLDAAFVEPEVDWLLPKKYSQTATSGLTVEVATDAPPVQLNLTSK